MALKQMSSLSAHRLFIYSLFALALLLRIMAALGDFAIDEAWSLLMVQNQASSIEHIYTRIKLDNNHILNSLWMFLLGEQSYWPLYRIPAVLGGIVTVVFMHKTARRFGGFAGFSALVLYGFSFPFVFYSSEARGYGLMMAFMAVNLYLILKMLEDFNWSKARLGLFWVSVVLGVFSHTTFVFYYGSVVLWSALRIKNSGKQGILPVLQKLSQLHAVPAIFLAAHYFAFIRDMGIGGGPKNSSIIQSLAVTSLGWYQMPFQEVFLAGLLLVICAGLYVIRKDYKELWVLFAAGIFCMPALSVLVFNPSHIASRYFLTSLFLAFLLP